MGDKSDVNLLDMEYLYCSAEKAEELSTELGEIISNSGYKPDIGIGILRGCLGGFLRVLIDILDLKKTTTIQIEHYTDVGERRKNPIFLQPLKIDVTDLDVLVSDDVSDTGKTFKVAKDYIIKKGAKDVKTASLHIKPWTKFVPDYYVEVTDCWVIYFWEKVKFIDRVVNDNRYTLEERREILYDRSGIPVNKLERIMKFRNYDILKV